jgi:hypothetical protein
LKTGWLPCKLRIMKLVEICPDESFFAERAPSSRRRQTSALM